MKSFDACKKVNEIIKFIRDYYAKNNLKGVVIGLSGGKDSAVVLALFAKALGNENVLALWLPIYSSDEDYQDVISLSEKFKIEFKTHDLTNIYDIYVRDIKKNNNVLEEHLIDANINIKSRLRMMSLYYYAAMYSKIKNGTYIVAGTSNKCERYVGYFTKGGDNVSDINILSNLMVSEVIEIGKYLEIDDRIIYKTPSDGLSGKSDEERLGVTYNDIEKVLNNENISEDIKNKINKLHQNNLHKFIIPEYKVER